MVWLLLVNGDSYLSAAAGKKYSLELFGGVVFVKAGSNITELSAIKTRKLRISAVSATGLGAMQLQWSHLQDMGIYIFADSAMVCLSSQ